jgi:hypothetical protein
MESIRRCTVLNFRPLNAGQFINQYEVKVNIPIPVRHTLYLAFAQQQHSIPQTCTTLSATHQLKLLITKGKSPKIMLLTAQQKH